MQLPTVKSPTREEIHEMAERQRLDLDESEVTDFLEVIERILQAYEELWELQPGPPDVPDRTDDGPPDSDPHNAVVRQCRASTTSDGPLAGVTVGLKDSISLAGVPMAMGSKALNGYVSERDATVVSRLLDAGATITAKLNMEEMAISASGEVSAFGPVLNPANPNYLAGGSSGGSAAAVVDGTVDASIGTDQAGSIRVPASWCGCVGLKPTFGLVPYTGIGTMEYSVDHVGPVATSVETCARLLEVLAGPDGRDSRWSGSERPPGSYVDAVDEGIDGLTVGVVEEGFGHDESDPAVDRTVRAALDVLSDAGADVREISVPWHLDGRLVHVGTIIEGLAATWRTDGVGAFVDGWYDTALADAIAAARRSPDTQFPPTLKLYLTLGEYLSETYGGEFYGTAKNLQFTLRAAYDEALETVDLLAMPTTPMTAHRVDDDLDRVAILDRATNMLRNTSPFNDSGHPAISVPCESVDGLPVGLMLVAAHGDDATVLRGAAGVSAARSDVTDWDN